MTKILLLVGLILIVALVFFKFFNKTKTDPSDQDKVANLSIDDRTLANYQDTAQKELPYLIQFMNEHDKDDTLFRYAVKSSFKERGNSEHMWVQVNEFKDNYFIGTLANEPSTLKEVNYGDTVKVHRDDVEDWILQDFFTNTEVGGFSREYIRNRAK